MQTPPPDAIQVHWRSFLGLAKVRLIQTYAGGPVYVPLADLAKAIGYRRSGLFAIIRRNAEDFAGEVFGVRLNENLAPRDAGQDGPAALLLLPPFQDAEIQGGWASPRSLCLSYEGLVGLLFMVETGRTKHSLKRARIRTFRDWATSLVPRAALTVPPEQLPFGLVDIVDLRPGRETGRAVREAAANASCSPRTIWRKVTTARIMAGRPRRARRADAVETTRPEDAARILGHLRDHPRARLKDLAALGTTLSHATIWRLRNEFRQARGTGGRKPA